MAPLYYVIVAFPCTIGAIALALLHIYRHLLNYTEPIFQRYIVRIIFMVPVYALMSFLSLVFNGSAIYFMSVREVYDAWVIYNFLSLCLAWVGGAGAVVVSLSGRVLKPSWYLMTCCFPAIPLDGRFIRRCKQGGLQFVILKPILVAITFVLYAKGKYEDGNFSVNQGYLYITIMYTISYTTALYALALFYVACRDLLRPYNPVPKFLMIKSVVFLTYWQIALVQDTLEKRNKKELRPRGSAIDFLESMMNHVPRSRSAYQFRFVSTLSSKGVLVFLAAKSDFIKNAEKAADFQNFILCVEMLVAAVGHLYAFPYKEYAGANIGTSRGLTGSLVHAVKFNDFYHDTVHQFAPTYHDYVLYNNTEGDEGATKYRSRTFVPTGHEMDAVRRNKHGGRLDDIQLSSVSTSGTTSPAASSTSHDLEAIKSSLLKEATASSAQPYDLSLLIDTDLSSYPAKVPAVEASKR